MEQGYKNKNATSNALSESTIKDQFLTFEIDDEDYGVEIEYIKEIIKICPITKVPHAENYIKGIINLRGEIIPVIDVRERFLKQSKEYDDLTCIIVIEYKDYNMGLLVDAVKEVMFIKEGQLQLPPSASYSYYNKFIKNIGKIGEDIKLIIDLDRLLLE